MNTLDILKTQTRVGRERIAELALKNGADADRIPSGWNNNLRWHVGHLVIVPRRLTSMQFGEPLMMPEDYNKWFGRDSSPRSWGNDPVPLLEQLTAELISAMDAVFADMERRLLQPYPKPMVTVTGFTLKNPADALMMNVIHDGIHWGMMLSMARALKQ
ncbi:MAG: DinB family protein [Candidatus Sumerlaeota bacterium]